MLENPFSGNDNEEIYFTNSSSEDTTQIYLSSLETQDDSSNETLELYQNQGDSELPIDMQFNNGHLLAIVVYSVLMVFSSIGNMTVFCIIFRVRRRQGRFSAVNLLLLHLTIADLLVTFLMMPLEIGWNTTVSWLAGDTFCRILSFTRIFGLYLSGFILMCISLDRYYAIVYPLSITNSGKRCRRMLTAAWFCSAICSLPQALIFHVESHPTFTWYQQCVTFNSFPTPDYELAYNFFGFTFLYGVPLITIVVCYASILGQIWKINSRRGREEQLRRSTIGAFGRAKIRTLKMTLMIVATFFLCWTPYNVMCLWYWLDSPSASQVDQRIQKGLFLFACTNSCMNPLIYGLFHFQGKSRNEISRSGTIT